MEKISTNPSIQIRVYYIYNVQSFSRVKMAFNSITKSE